MSIEKDYNILLGKLAENIKRARIGKGLTQEDMVKFGFSYRHYQRVESGVYSPNLFTLFRLSKAFKVSIDEFFT